MTADAGLIEMEVRTGFTVTVVDADSEPKVAVMTAVPAERPLTTPVLLTEATSGAEELHTIELVTSCVEPSL